MTSIEEKYIQLHPKSKMLFEEAKDLFPDGVTHDARRMNPFPIYITRAEGCKKWDEDGNQYIDYIGGHGAHLLGHSHPEIVKAISEQIPKGTQYAFSTKLEVQWGKLVKNLIPSIEKIRFQSTGTEATLMALRMARAYTGKSKIIKFEEHYHGWHDYVMAGYPKGLGGIPKETLNTMIVLPPSNLQIVEKTLTEDSDIAGIIVEASGAHMGNVPILPEFLHGLRELANKYEVVLIMDEVVTGFRVSKGGVQGSWGIDPDITTLGKVLGGGIPAAAVGGKKEFIDMIAMTGDTQHDNINRITHAGTFNATPIAAVAGIKALELVANSDVNVVANQAAQRFKNGINHLLSKIEIPGCATGLASIVQLRLNWDHICDKEFCMVTGEDILKAQDPKIVNLLRLALLNEGVHMGGHTQLFSSAHTDKDIDQTLAAYEKALTLVRDEGLF